MSSTKLFKSSVGSHCFVRGRLGWAAAPQTQDKLLLLVRYKVLQLKQDTNGMTTAPRHPFR